MALGLTSMEVNGFDLGSCQAPAGTGPRIHACLSNSGVESLVESQTLEVVLHHNIYSGLSATVTLHSELRPETSAPTPAPTPAPSPPSPVQQPGEDKETPAPTTQDPHTPGPTTRAPTPAPADVPTPPGTPFTAPENFGAAVCGVSYSPEAILETRLATATGCALLCEARSQRPQELITVMMTVAVGAGRVFRSIESPAAEVRTARVSQPPTANRPPANRPPATR